VSLLGELNLEDYKKLNTQEVFSDLEDIIYVLKEMNKITEDVLIEMVSLCGDKVDGLKVVEPSVVFGRCVTNEKALNTLYSLNLEKINQYLMSCTMTPDDILVKLLNRGYDQRKILSNMKSKSLRKTLKKMIVS
jgi:hypothetical protein